MILRNEEDVRATFKKFANQLWPGKEVPENRFWPLLKTFARGVKYCKSDYADRKYRVDIGPVISLIKGVRLLY